MSAKKWFEKLKKPKTVTIDRAKWLCGENDDSPYSKMGPTELLNGKGNMCCLGFFAEQCGVPKKAIKGLGEPENVLAGSSADDRYVPIPSLTKYDGDCGIINSSLSIQAIELNDDPDLDSYDRETALRRLFSKFRVKLKFKGKYPKADKDAGLV